MPGMLGSDFLLEVRRLYPDVVTILLTGFSEASEIVKIVRAGIFSFILKPWDATYLLAELTKAYDFREMRLENERYTKTIEDELRWAGELQRTILKPQLPRCEGLEFRVSYHPVSGLFCGGDYYDVIFVGNDRYLVLIGDVEGHGVKAAIVTGMLKATIYSEFVRGMIGKQFSPGAFLGWLNSRMNFEFRSASSMIITFFAGVMDVKASRFVYANAGHCHPFVVRGGRADRAASLGLGDRLRGRGRLSRPSGLHAPRGPVLHVHRRPRGIRRGQRVRAARARPHPPVHPV